MKTLAPLIITLLLVLPFATPAPAADAPNFQTVCPVMGGKINRTLFVDHDGKRVYFCCPGGCADKFKADPAKYLDKMKADGVELEKTPASDDAAPKTERAPGTKMHHGM